MNIKKTINLTVFITFIFLSFGAKAQQYGKWVVSQDNERYQFGGGILEADNSSLIANYKDESVIIAGLQTPKGAGSPSYQFIDRSTDGGKSWHRLFQETNAAFHFDFIAHPSPAHIVALASVWVKDSVGADVKQHIVMSSSDTGVTWTIDSLNFNVFPNGQTYYNGTLLHFNGANGIILSPSREELWYSYDYGASWQKIELPADLRTSGGAVLDGGGVFLSNGGTRKAAYNPVPLGGGVWEYYPQLPEYFSRVAVVDRNVFWAVGKEPEVASFLRTSIRGTSNGGQEWEIPLDLYEELNYQRRGLSRIAFSGAQRGAAIGFGALSYLTEDGGVTWQKYDMLGELSWNLPRGVVYYYNPITHKSMLLALMDVRYVYKFDFDAVDSSNTNVENILGAEGRLNVYPNPANRLLNIDISSEHLHDSKGYTVKIMATDGRLISSKHYTKTIPTHNEDISHLSQGLYMVQVVSSYGVSRALFVKE